MKQKGDLESKILELQTQLKDLKSKEERLKTSIESNSKLESDLIEASRTLALSINEQIKKKEKAKRDLIAITPKMAKLLVDHTTIQKAHFS